MVKELHVFKESSFEQQLYAFYTDMFNSLLLLGFTTLLNILGHHRRFRHRA